MFTTHFTQDADNARMHVERRFKAPRQLVWDAFSKPELLERWLAPAPWKAVTVSMDFTTGGEWRYYMLGPAGEKHYSLAKYLNVVAPELFEAMDCWTTDDSFTIDHSMPVSTWNARFTDEGDVTLVQITMNFPDATAMNQTVEMGFIHGYTMSHDQLDALLPELLGQ